MAEGAGLAQEELERLIFFEAAKEQAKLEVKKNPKDVQALIRWGGALLELAHLKQVRRPPPLPSKDPAH